MKRVSLKVAKALKESGYPQDENEERKMRGLPEQIDIPSYLEVWLWLWREKDIKYEIVKSGDKVLCKEGQYQFHYMKDPEEAIIAAIDYLVENDLIK